MKCSETSLFITVMNTLDMSHRLQPSKSKVLSYSHHLEGVIGLIRLHDHHAIPNRDRNPIEYMPLWLDKMYCYVDWNQHQMLYLDVAHILSSFFPPKNRNEPYSSRQLVYVISVLYKVQKSVYHNNVHNILRLVDFSRLCLLVGSELPRT